MNTQWQRKKPKNITYAERSLLVWTAWTTLFGIYRTWAGLDELTKQITEQSSGLLIISPSTLLQSAIAGYIAIAILSVWIIFEIHKGKHWARSSFMWGFIFQVLMFGLPPYNPPLEYLTNAPDIALQVYSLYLLYTWPGENWFKPHPAEER